MDFDKISNNLYNRYIKEDLKECLLCFIKLPTFNFYYFVCGHNYCQYCCVKILSSTSTSKCPCCLKVDYNLYGIIKKNCSISDYYYNKGCDFYKISKYDIAINLFNKSIMHGNINSFFKLASCYLKKNDINKYVQNLINYLFKSDTDDISDIDDINGNKIRVALFLSNFFLKNEYNIEYSYFFNTYITETIENLKEINENDYNYFKKYNILLYGYINYKQLEDNYKHKDKNISYINKLNDIIKILITFFEYKYNRVDIIHIDIINDSVNIIFNNFDIQHNFDKICNLYSMINKYNSYICNFKIKENNILMIKLITIYINCFKKIDYKSINDDKINKIIKISEELYQQINKSKVNNKSAFLYDLSGILSSSYLLKSNNFTNRASGIKLKRKNII
jgi:hypothetical protein